MGSETVIGWESAFHLRPSLEGHAIQMQSMKLGRLDSEVEEVAGMKLVDRARILIEVAVVVVSPIP